MYYHDTNHETCTDLQMALSTVWAVMKRDADTLGNETGYLAVAHDWLDQGKAFQANACAAIVTACTLLNGGHNPRLALKVALHWMQKARRAETRAAKRNRTSWKRSGQNASNVRVIEAPRLAWAG